MAKKKRQKPRERRHLARAPIDVMEEMNREIDRRVEKWARQLRIIDGGKVRRLTEKEVRIVVRRGRK